MLGQLHIKNIGIIDEITINFEDGLNIITGETGAGKSLIIGSINAICGGKISKEIIKEGASEGFIEACFFGKEDIILTREFYKNGRNIYKINGKMVTLGEFKAVGESLVDIHGQHDNQSLLNEKTHIELLDGFAKNTGATGSSFTTYINNYKTLLGEYKNLKQEIANSYGDPLERARRIDLLKYQHEEIKNSNLKIGEEDELNEKHSLIMNHEKIAKNLNEAHDIISDNTLDGLEKAISNLKTISSYDEKFQTILDELNNAYYTAKEASMELASLRDSSDFDENEQQKVEERLDTLFSLKRKYGNDIGSILKYKDEIEKEIFDLENSDEIVSRLNKRLEEVNDELKSIAEKNREVRKTTAEVIEKTINKEFKDLEMKNAFIKFNFETSDSFLENGMDVVRILICTNAGESLKPLSKIASGGEISRVMLAIKTVLCEFDNVPTMVFDEIDSGISGQAGIAVADKMKKICKTHQVICVTHLATIAAAGTTNFFIEKSVENGKTKTKVKKLGEEETINEIARILVGKDITKAVLEHALELRKR